MARCEPKHAAATICGTSATTKPAHRLLCPRCCASNCQHTCHQKGCVKPFACTPAPLQQIQCTSVCASSGQHSASLVVISTATQRSTQLAHNCCSARDSHAHRPSSRRSSTWCPKGLGRLHGKKELHNQQLQGLYMHSRHTPHQGRQAAVKKSCDSHTQHSQC
mgnify:CR=1 FL=1